MKKVYLFICICLTVLFSQGDINKTFDGISSIEIQVASSDVFFKKSSNKSVVLNVRHTFDDDEMPIIEKRGKRLVIKEENRSRSWSSNKSAKYKLQIPNGVRVSYNSGSGMMEMSNVKLEKASFNTGSADFHIENVDVEKGLKINSGSSEVEMKNVSAEIRINTGSGDVDIDGIKGSVSFNAGSGDITVKRFTILEDCSFNNGSGDAKISLANEPKADISMNSGSGNVTIDYNGNKIDAYVEMRAKRERNIRAPFEFDESREVDNWNNRYYEKTAKVGNASIDISMHTGSGRAEIKK